ncbi:hypothetical protein KEM52_002064, partial [Ascosphaera acerosa]
ERGSDSGYAALVERVLSGRASQSQIPLKSVYELNLQAGRSTPLAMAAGFASPALMQKQNFSKPIRGQESVIMLRSRVLQHMAGRHAEPNKQKQPSPSFLTSFIRRCFVADLEYIDFPQALTALDYVRDLEVRRIAEMEAVLDRLAHLDGPHQHGIDSTSANGLPYSQ